MMFSRVIDWGLNLQSNSYLSSAAQKTFYRPLVDKVREIRTKAKVPENW